MPVNKALLDGFYDSRYINEDAVDALAALVTAGIMQGDSYSRLNPTHSLTRAEMAALLYRAIG